MFCAEPVNSVEARESNQTHQLMRVVRHVLLSADIVKKTCKIRRDFRRLQTSIASISGTDQDITPNRVTSFNVAWTL